MLESTRNFDQSSQYRLAKPSSSSSRDRDSSLRDELYRCSEIKVRAWDSVRLKSKAK